MTNYERIKQMTVEEMVVFLGSKPYCYLENGEVDCIYGGTVASVKNTQRNGLKVRLIKNE